MHSAIINRRSKYYSKMKNVFDEIYEDNYFGLDSVYMERNSRDYATRIKRINRNAQAVGHFLKDQPESKCRAQQ